MRPQLDHRPTVNRKSTRVRLFPFQAWTGTITRQTLQKDLLAGLTGAFIVLPQGVSFAMIAGLPAEYGLYTAIVPPIIAALFGSSRHLVSGPTTAISILTFSTLSVLAEPMSGTFIQLAITMTFLAGIFQMLFGLAQLGSLVNFVSHSVVVGFTTGAAVLIAAGQVKHSLGIDVPGGSSFLTTLVYLYQSSGQANLYEMTIAGVTLVCAAGLKAYRPKWPGLLIALILGSLISIGLDGQVHGVRLLGRISGSLPPLSLPDFDPDTIRTVAPGALAVALLGLLEALSIARSISVQSRQHIDGNQEFIGQGLSNIAGSFFSAYAGSGSFTRSGVNYDAGAQTPLASIFSALFLSGILILIAPLTAWLPLSAMGAVILVVAFRLIDVYHIREIFRSSRADTAVLLVTLLSTLIFELDFAIYTGVLLSLAIYLTRTAHPRIDVLAPDPTDIRRQLALVEENSLAECPQLKIIQITGPLFFGDADHLSETIEKIDKRSPRHLLVVGYGINYMDVSGAIMLTQEAARRRSLHKTLNLCRINCDIFHFLGHGDFLAEIGEDHVFSTEYDAIAGIFKQLDPEICRICRARIFTECCTIPPIPDPSA